MLTDDDEIRTLNRTYRKHDRATDVLSFHLQELAGEGDPAGDGVALGDIVISLETARRRAPGKRLVTEAERLAIHGLCHLFGHDHKRPGRGEGDVRARTPPPPPESIVPSASGGLGWAAQKRIPFFARNRNHFQVR